MDGDVEFPFDASKFVEVEIRQVKEEVVSGMEENDGKRESHSPEVVWVKEELHSEEEEISEDDYGESELPFDASSVVDVVIGNAKEGFDPDVKEQSRKGDFLFPSTPLEGEEREAEDVNLEGNKESRMDGKPFQCNVCAKSFTRRSTLRSHMLLHSGEKPFKCNVCGKCFTWETNLKAHMLVHSGGKPNKCSVCGKCFKWKSNIKPHMLVHSGGKPFKCNVCGKCYTQSSTLNTHMLIHSGSKIFKCKVCGKCCTRKSHLKSHMSIHSSDKPFKCDVCGNCFSLKSNLNRHKRSHLDAKP